MHKAVRECREVLSVKALSVAASNPRICRASLPLHHRQPLFAIAQPIVPNPTTFRCRDSSPFASQVYFVPFPPGRFRGPRCQRPPPSLSSLSERIHGLRTEICLCKRRTRIRRHNGGLNTFRSVVRLSAGAQNVSDSPHSPLFPSDAPYVICAPSVLVDHPCSPPPAYTKILRMVRDSSVNQLYPNVPRVHITHRVPRSRS